MNTTTSVSAKHAAYDSKPDEDSKPNEYDVVIMGAGFAGVCQARHLLLKIPDIRIALVDPRGAERTEKDLKVGESLIEVAALFLAKELGLHDYLIERHTPKFGLNFHWPKKSGETESLDDYFHVWANRQTPIASFHLQRARFEQDLLEMNRAMGAEFVEGYVVDLDLPPGDAVKTVTVRTKSEKLEKSEKSEKSDKPEKIELKAKHVIDAAGRRFLIGKAKDNVVSDAESLMGLDSGSAWLRVKNVDRSLFHSGYHPGGTSASPYYATNHYFGQGHWVWMIPTDRQTNELSIGVVHHNDVIPASTLNSRDKLQAFLKANHSLVSQVIDSGEIEDFHYLPRLAHKSKTLFSEDNWYVIGDAAQIFDAFYSYGTTMTAFAVESVTEIIRAKRSEEADAETKRAAYNAFNQAYGRSVNCLYRGHSHQLGNASVMSWRIYFEYMWWFGVHIPMYVGKWHLDYERFIPRYEKIANGNVDGLFADLCEQFDELVDSGKNIGLMDAYRADQLVGDYTPLKHFDDFLENTKFEPRRCNVFASMKRAYWYIALWYVLFQWKGFGLAGVLAPKHLYYTGRMLVLSMKAAIAEVIYKSKTKGKPLNSHIDKMRKEFKTYQHQAAWQPSVQQPVQQSQPIEQDGKPDDRTDDRTDESELAMSTSRS